MEKLNKYISITISLIIITFSIWFILIDKKDFSDNEFRYLEKWPTLTFDSLFEGEYIKSLESYFTDHFPLRDNFVELKTKVYYDLGQRLINNVYIADDNFLINKFDKPQNSDKIIDILNKFQLNNKDINIEMIISPTSTSIYSNLLPNNNINYSEKDAIDYYYDKLNINTIDIYSILLEQKENYQLFYKTDHHWTTYGAYFAYKKYCEVNNIECYSIEDFNVELVSNEFLGTTYSKIFWNKDSKDEIYAFNLENSNFTVEYLTKTTNSLYNNDYLSKKDKYSYFLDNNQPLIKITNNNIKNNSEILIIKDSYANSFIPLLANNYKKIHVIDPRYYNLSISDYIKENNINNVLLLYNINNIDNDLGILNIK